MQMSAIVQFSFRRTRLRAAALAGIAALTAGCTTSGGAGDVAGTLGSAAQQEAAQTPAGTAPGQAAPGQAAPGQTGPGQTASGQAVPGQTAAAPPPADEVQDPRAYCPKTVLRAGTETYNVFPDKVKKDDPAAPRLLRFRATITEVVRECNYAGEFLNIKVGVAGRLISGPSGETGQFTMPLRVAVTAGETVLYTKLHEVPAELPPGRPNSTFRFVDSQVSIPKPTKENVVIYVGFDEQRTDAVNGNKKQSKVN
jgi:predicted small secreted protein